MPESEDDRARLARLMNDRRMALGLKWSDVAAAGGTSPETLRAVRRESAPLRDLTKAGIARGLQWTTDSVDRVLGGGNPVQLEDEYRDQAGPPAGAPEVVRSNWDDSTVRDLWGKPFAEDARLTLVKFYLTAAAEGARRREAATDAEITQLRRANGA